MAKTGTQIAPSRTFRALSADPFRELFDLQRGINQLFNASISAPHEEVALKAWTPAVDVYEDENAFLIKVELPEVNREEVKVSLNENTLSISGERRVENEQKRENYHRVERSYGSFMRTFTLPSTVDVRTSGLSIRMGSCGSLCRSAKRSSRGRFRWR